MKIEKIQIKNYRSIANSTAVLQDLNIFIGPNGSGKSNFLKGIEFFGELLTALDKEVLEAKKLVKNNMRKEALSEKGKGLIDPLSFAVLVSFPEKNNQYVFKFELYDVEKIHFAIFYGVKFGREAKLPLVDIDFGLHEIAVLESTFDSFQINIIGDSFKKLAVNYSGNSNTANLERFLNDSPYIGLFRKNRELAYERLEANSNPSEIFKRFNKIYGIRNIVNFIKEFTIYKPSIDDIQDLQELGNEIEYFLDGSCFNIVQYLDTINSYYPKILKKINQDLRKCIPEFHEIRIIYPTKEEMEEVEDKKKAYKKVALCDSNDKIFEAKELSDGILYFISLLCIINQPDPPHILALEEPETGIHPRRIKELIGFVQEVAENAKVQVIITSHSPLVLKEFNYNLSTVHIFEKNKDGTIIKNLEKDIVESSNERLRSEKISPIDFAANLDENWLNGMIDGVPID